MSDALKTLGTLIDGTQGRDAIHLAVIPVKAAEALNPGENVTLNGSTTNGDLIGIVDPFLPRVIREGETFWLILYPRTITNLRHSWTHPDVPNETAPPKVEVTVGPIDLLQNRSVTTSKKWIAEYAESLQTHPSDLMYAAEDWISYEEVLIQGGKFEGIVLLNEFWNHYETVSKTIVPEEKRGSFFSCSC